MADVSEHLCNWAICTFLWDQAVQRQADRMFGRAAAKVSGGTNITSRTDTAGGVGTPR